MGEKIDFNNLLSNWKKVAERYNIKWRNSFLEWELPPNIGADFALTLALPISHKTKRNPLETAHEIVKATACPSLECNITEKGYINFSFPTDYYQHFFAETLKKTTRNLAGKPKDIRINIEYVSANPTGYLHLAHFRHAFVGNTLASVYKFLGYEVIREYYINDRGGQINSLISSVYHFYHQFQGTSLPNSAKMEYSGKSSQEIAQNLIKKWGSKYVSKELSKEDFMAWKKEVLELILSKIRQDLEKGGVRFDIWFSETSLYEKNKYLELLEKLKKKT